MVDRHFCPFPTSLFWEVLITMFNQSESRSIQPMIFEVMVWFSFRGLSYKEMSGIDGVSEGDITKVLQRDTSSLTQGLCGHQ